MKEFSQLKKNLKNDFSNLKAIKIALLGDTATQFLTTAIRGTGFDRGYDLQIMEADFNQIEQQIFNPQSELYQFEPEVVIVFQSAHKLLDKYNKLSHQLYHTFADNQLNTIRDLYSAINKKAKIIFYNYPEIDDAVFGNYANKVEQSFLFQQRKLNYGLMNFALSHPDLYIVDLSSVQNLTGKAMMFQPSVYVNTEMVLSLDILPLLASRTVDVIASLYGNFKKCLIVDLDNTIWGGIIGDDGLENIQLGSLGIGKAFTEFQYWIKKLKNRGIIIAICSKNTESIALDAFENHPDMVLTKSDIAVFVANWDNKADNINKIISALNIGADSVVFLDDNPVERAMIRDNIPEITVPELPVDPADYLEYLYSLNLFETASFSEEDSERTKHYQVEARRSDTSVSFTNENDFLKSLNMLCRVNEFNKFNTPRLAQLSQRSNQFNLRTIRYTEADIESLIGEENILALSFTLEDKFGDNGLIGMIVLKEESKDVIFIDTWLMSCRVLKRGMENFMLNSIAELSKQKGYSVLKGEYIPSSKNEIVKDHYLNLGFISSGDHWFLGLADHRPKPCHIAAYNS